VASVWGRARVARAPLPHHSPSLGRTPYHLHISHTPHAPVPPLSPLAAFPFRPDFLATAHRGSRAGSGLACADLPPIGPIPPGLAAAEARWRLARVNGGGGRGAAAGGARPAESEVTAATE
jgi:hypothetical protein